MSQTETAVTPKVITLVGHCGPDSSFLRMAVSAAVPGAGVVVTLADSDRELEAALASKPDLLMLNRTFDFGFDETDGVEMLKQIKQRHPDQKVMMISNYPETQADAEAAGALPGFGKREIGSEKVKLRIADALKGDSGK